MTKANIGTELPLRMQSFAQHLPSKHFICAAAVYFYPREAHLGTYSIYSPLPWRDKLTGGAIARDVDKKLP